MFTRVILAMGLSLLLAQASPAALIFSDGFEMVPGDNGPDLSTSAGDYDPAWTFVTESLSPRQVVVYTSDATDSSAGSAANLITPIEGNQAVRLRAGGTAMAQGFTPVTQATATLWHLEPAGNANTGRMLTVELREGSTAAVTVGFDNDTSAGWGFGYIDGDGVFHKLTDAQTNQWTEIAVFADTISGTFIVSYDGTVYDNDGAGYALRNAVTSISAIRLGQSAAAGSTLNSYVDDIQVHDTNVIPEPATAMLMMAGILTMLRRRRA